MTATQKNAAESARRKLKSLSWPQLAKLVDEGVTEFHNGGVRRRHIVATTWMYVLYNTTPNCRHTSGVPRDLFVKWCRGYVKDGVRYVLGEDDNYIVYDQIEDKEVEDNE
jgi:hypothetical protein